MTDKNSEDFAEFGALSEEDSAHVVKIYNLLSGGITDPHLQALLVYRHLVYVGWLPPGEAESLAEIKDNAVQDLKAIRKELDG